MRPTQALKNLLINLLVLSFVLGESALATSPTPAVTNSPGPSVTAAGNTVQLRFKNFQKTLQTARMQQLLRQVRYSGTVGTATIDPRQAVIEARGLMDKLKRDVKFLSGVTMLADGVLLKGDERSYILHRYFENLRLMMQILLVVNPNENLQLIRNRYALYLGESSADVFTAAKFSEHIADAGIEVRTAIQPRREFRFQLSDVVLASLKLDAIAFTQTDEAHFAVACQLALSTMYEANYFLLAANNRFQPEALPQHRCQSSQYRLPDLRQQVIDGHRGQKEAQLHEAILSSYSPVFTLLPQAKTADKAAAQVYEEHLSESVIARYEQEHGSFFTTRIALAVARLIAPDQVFESEVDVWELKNYLLSAEIQLQDKYLRAVFLSSQTQAATMPLQQYLKYVVAQMKFYAAVEVLANIQQVAPKLKQIMPILQERRTRIADVTLMRAIEKWQVAIETKQKTANRQVKHQFNKSLIRDARTLVSLQNGDWSRVDIDFAAFALFLRARKEFASEYAIRLLNTLRSFDNYAVTLSVVRSEIKKLTGFEYEQKQEVPGTITPVSKAELTALRTAMQKISQPVAGENKLVRKMRLMAGKKQLNRLRVLQNLVRLFQLDHNHKEAPKVGDLQLNKSELASLRGNYEIEMANRNGFYRIDRNFAKEVSRRLHGKLFSDDINYDLAGVRLFYYTNEKSYLLRNNLHEEMQRVADARTLDDLRIEVIRSRHIISMVKNFSVLTKKQEEYIYRHLHPGFTEQLWDSLIHKYVMPGFLGLLALHGGRWLTSKFRVTAGLASTLQVMDTAIAPYLMGFTVSAMSLILADFGKHTYEITYIEQAKRDRIRKLSESGYRKSDVLFDYLEAESADLQYQTELFAYRLRALIDGLFILGLPVIVLGARYAQVALASRYEKAYGRLFKTAGFKRGVFDWNANVIRDTALARRKQLVELSSRIRAQKSLQPKQRQRRLRAIEKRIQAVARAERKLLRHLNHTASKWYQLWFRHKYDFEALAIHKPTWNRAEIATAERRLLEFYSSREMPVPDHIQAAIQNISRAFLQNAQLAGSSQLRHALLKEVFDSRWVVQAGRRNRVRVESDTKVYHPEAANPLYSRVTVQGKNGQAIELIVPRLRRAN